MSGKGPEELAALVKQGKDKWEELKGQWNELGLPGSYYSPDEFVACLLLSETDCSAEELARRVRGAAETLKRLRQDLSMHGSLLGLDTVPIMLLAKANGSVETAREAEASAHPIVTAGSEANEPSTVIEAAVSLCPHCDHSFSECASGAYKSAEDEAPREDETPESVPAVHGSCEHVDAGGKCVLCTKEETVECSSCDNAVILSKSRRCEREDCDIAYCAECAEQNLSKYGYCDDCRTLSCDGCQNDVEAGEEKQCQSKDCVKNDFCEECGQSLLTVSGLCASCANEEELNCSDCDNVFLASRVAKCRNFGDCASCYCASCKDKNLDSQGSCEDCRSS